MHIQTFLHTTTLAAMLAAGITRPLTAQLPLASIDGSNAGDQFGHAVASVDDRRLAPVTPASGFVVGARYGDLFFPDIGTVTAFRWSTNGLSTRWMAPGSLLEDEYGFAIANAPDQNLNLVTDLLVGSPGADQGATANTGRMDLLEGESGGLLVNLSSGLFGGWRGGEGIAFAGDVDGNSVADFLVGSPDESYSCSPLAARRCGNWALYDGANHARWHSVRGRRPGYPNCISDRLGRALAPVGDLDGDLLPEFLVGSENEGVVRVYGWQGTAASINPKWTITGVPGDFGNAVCGLGDITGDSIPDFAVGSAASGKVHIFSGADVVNGTTAAWRVLDYATLLTGGGRFGHALANTGDTDGDGLNDLLVGAPTAGGTGMAFLFSGQTWAVLAFVKGDQGGDQMGFSVSGVPDLTGDGLAEFVVGAPSADVPNGGGTLVDAGMARLMTLDFQAPGAGIAGAGCGPAPGLIPRIGLPNGCAYVGHSAFGIGVAGGTKPNLALLVIGTAQFQPPIPVPPLPGCTLGVNSPISVTTALIGGNHAQGGIGRHPINIPANTALAGVTVHAQWYVASPGPAVIPGVMSMVLTLAVALTRC